jgi:hypothetical protein
MVGRIADAAPTFALPAGNDFPDKFDHVESGDVGNRPVAPRRNQIAAHDDLDITEGTQFFSMLL